MKLLNRIFIRIYGPLLLITSCVSPFDFRVDNTSGQVIISGQVSSIQDRTIVTIGRTASGRLPVPEEHASVVLLDGNDSFIGMFSQTAPGNYILYGFNGLPNMGYKVQVTLSNGRIYESAEEVMPYFAPSVNVIHQFHERTAPDLDGDNVSQRFIDLFASTTIPAEWDAPYFFWSVEELYLLSPTDFPDPFGQIPPPCFVSQKIATSKRALFNGSLVNSNSIDGTHIHERKVDRTFLEKHYFTTYQSSITKEAYDYWLKVNTIAYQEGSIFDVPPAQIPGNIRNVSNADEKVWGFFQASNESFNRFFVLPSDFPYPLLFPSESCTFDGTRWEYPPYCMNCLTAEGSSYTRPDWF